MATSRTSADGPAAAAPVTLLVKSSPCAAADILHCGLRAAGLRVIRVATAYDAVIEAQRAGDALAHLVLGVDPFGRDEFRLIPLVRREWPQADIIVYHSSGFEYKGRIAELVGADLVLSTPAAVESFIESLAAPGPTTVPPAPSTPAAPEPAAPAHAEAAAAPAPSPAPAPVVAAESPPASAPIPAETQSPAVSREIDLAIALAARSAKTAPQSPRRKPPPPHTPPEDPLEGSKIIGTIALTEEEELRLLLGEDEPPPGSPP